MTRRAVRSILCLAIVFAAEARLPAQSSKESPTPIFFVENGDRYDDTVRFHVEHATGGVLFEDRAIIFRETGRDDLRLEFPGANRAARVRGEQPLETRMHYLVGPERDWRVDVPTCARLRYADLWPGVDLVLDAARDAIKYEFHLAPGADPSAIRMRYVGAHLSVEDDGTLRVDGPSARTDPKPVSSQCVGGATLPVVSRFAIDPDRDDTVGFAIGDYDSTQPLVIDPVFAVYSGYGPAGIVDVYDVAVDATDATIFVGTVRPGTGTDIAVVKVRPDGSGFAFMTILGAPGVNDYASGVAVDATGIYLAGDTHGDENTFPVRVGPVLRASTKPDAFACKLAHDGRTILYSGFVGGNHIDNALDVAVHAGALWVVGQTRSSDFPIVRGPQTTRLGNGNGPGFVTKIAPDGRSFLLSGYLGGLWDSTCSAIAIDTAGDAYVVGMGGQGLPVTVGPDLTWAGGFEVFIAKIDGTSASIAYWGYVGGARDEFPDGVAVDTTGAAYVIGSTRSQEPTFPLVRGPLTSYRQGLGGDGFIAKVDPGGTGFVYSGYLGGFRPADILVDTSGRCTLAGRVWAIPLPFPIGGALSGALAAISDGFVTRLAADGLSFDYGGFYGGADQDEFVAMARGPSGAIHAIGKTLSRDLPFRVGPNAIPSGAFVMKMGQTVAGCPLTAPPGSVVPVDCVASEDVGARFQLATSLGGGPIWLPGNRRLALAPDWLFRASILGLLPGIFGNYAGTVPASGEWRSTIRLPAAGSLVGVNLFTSFVTFAPDQPGGIQSVANATPLTVRP